MLKMRKMINFFFGNNIKIQMEFSQMYYEIIFVASRKLPESSDRQQISDQNQTRFGCILGNNQIREKTKFFSVNFIKIIKKIKINKTL